MSGTLRINNFNNAYTIPQAIAVLAQVIELDGGKYYKKAEATRQNRKSTGQLLYAALNNNTPPPTDPNNYKLVIGEAILKLVQQTNGKFFCDPLVIDKFLSKVKAAGPKYTVTSEDIPILLVIFQYFVPMTYLSGQPTATLYAFGKSIQDKIVAASAKPKTDTATNENADSPKELYYNIKFTCIERGVPIFSTKEGNICVLYPWYLHKVGVDAPRYFSNKNDNPPEILIPLETCIKIKTTHEPKLKQHPVLNKLMHTVDHYEIVKVLV